MRAEGSDKPFIRSVPERRPFDTESIVPELRTIPQDPHIYWNLYLPMFFDCVDLNLRRHMNTQVANYGIVGTHTAYIIMLAMHGAMSIKDMSEYLGTDESNVINVIKVLMDRGYVSEKREDDRDIKITLTKQGNKVSGMVIWETALWMDSMTDGVSKEEMQSTYDVLYKILARIDPEFDGGSLCKHPETSYTNLLANHEDLFFEFMRSGGSDVKEINKHQ